MSETRKKYDAEFRQERSGSSRKRRRRSPRWLATLG